MLTSRLARPTAAFKVALGATLVLASVAMTASLADAVDIGSNDSVNTYRQTTEFIDHDLQTVVTLDRTKMPGGLGDTTIDWDKTNIDYIEKVNWNNTVRAALKIRQATGWDVGNPNQRTRLINELKTVSRAMDNEMNRGSKGRLNLPKERQTANLLYQAVRKTEAHVDCRGRCLKYTLRSVTLTTVFTVLGAAAGAGYFGAALPVVIGVSAVAGILCYLMDTLFMMRKAHAALTRDIRARRESAQAQQFINAFILEAAEEGIRLGAVKMQAQLNAMAAQINRVESSVTANSQVDLRP